MKLKVIMYIFNNLYLWKKNPTFLSIHLLFMFFINIDVLVHIFHQVCFGYYMFLRQQVIWCPSICKENTKSRVDLKNM